MNKRYYLILFLAALLIAAGAAFLEKTPGYMDADYYYAGARRIASGQGASEPYLWNYLNDPAALPAPSFAYWMPLVSLVTAVGLRLFPGWGFWGARVPLIFLAALIPPVTALLTYRLWRRPDLARLAGILALFPGFYLAYLPTSDAFPLEMILGALFFLLVASASGAASSFPPLRGGTQGGAIFTEGIDHGQYRPSPNLSPQGRGIKSLEARFFALGLLAGLLHLARADGVLWVGGALAAVYLAQRQCGQLKIPRLLLGAVVVLVGYLLVLSPWLARNLGEWGSFFPPGGSRAMWVSEYEQTMIYPAALLTPAAWLAADWGTHLRARLDAAGVILQTALAVQGGILLFPFMLGGLWQMRRRAEVWLGCAMWLLLALLMTLVFPFAAANGSYFHSAAALQPFLWAAAPLGLESLMLMYARWRKAPRPQELVRFMALLAVITMVLLSGVIYIQRVAGSQEGGLQWNAGSAHYQLVEAELVRLGAQPGDPVLVNNAPGYWLASQRPALVIPYGDTSMLLAVARRFDARYLVLEQNNPWQLSDLFHARIQTPELEYLSSVGTTRLYRITPEK